MGEAGAEGGQGKAGPVNIVEAAFADLAKGQDADGQWFIGVMAGLGGLGGSLSG